MPKKESTGKTLRVTWSAAPIGYTKDQKATVRALGSAPHASDCRA